MKGIRKLMLAVMVMAAMCLMSPNVLPVESNISTAEAKTKISKKSVTLNLKSATQFMVKGLKKKVKWSSSNKYVATVNRKGIVVAKHCGTATITAKAGNKKYKRKVKVIDTAPTSVFSVSATNLSVTDSGSVNVTLTQNGSVTCKVGNCSIISCSWEKFNGDTAPLNITVLKPGTTTITVTNTVNSETAVITVNASLSGNTVNTCNNLD